MSDHIEHACHKCGSLICSGRCSQDLIGRAYAAYHGPDVEKIDKLKDVVVEAAEKYLYESQLHPCPDLTLRRVYLDNLRKALSKLRERQLTVVEQIPAGAPIYFDRDLPRVRDENRALSEKVEGI